MNALDLGRVGIWAGEMDRYPALALRQAAAAIDDLGYPALWFPETTGREAMTQAALLLSATRQTVIATGTASIYARDAVSAAAAQRTLAEAFPGRFLLGLGVSHPALVTDVRGHRFGPPVATMRAYLDAMDAAPFGPPIPAPPSVPAAGPEDAPARRRTRLRRPPAGHAGRAHSPGQKPARAASAAGGHPARRPGLIPRSHGRAGPGPRGGRPAQPARAAA
ncbi:LLM class flavin-dependent oxidoreductase [Nonomuraea lactucae]|uniref:LLM class flavin-dependent oxidoreductase n=1 Tax=Nonomuraea lactucae TaxID=2249762 RepID=UPI000DE1F6ED|nr:LLM class flavin-dependent oxidoreductase [Nonomuraea lactucae]